MSVGPPIRLDGRVAIVTGAGRGLGRAHALSLAARGARVVVNDHSPQSAAADHPAAAVAREIAEAGGEAVAHFGSVADQADAASLVAAAIDRWGRIDILVNNAGILRDRTFAKMPAEDFRAVVDVHLMGAVHCTAAAWPWFAQAGFGRIVMTTSSSGLYGNFGQSNYGAAKMALVGLMKTLAIEGARHGIRVNCLAPTAATAMTEGLLDAETLALFAPETIVPGLIALVADDAPTGTILCAGAGGFEQAHVTLTRGVYVDPHSSDAAERVLAALAQIADGDGQAVPASGAAQFELEGAKARTARGDRTR